MTEAHAAAHDGHHDSHEHPHGSHEHPQAHGHAHPPYFAVFIGLIVCTVLSVLIDLLPAKGSLVMIVGAAVLAVAATKAMLVMAYFMHLKFEGPWKFVLLAPTTVLALFLMVALMPDIGLHYYSVQTPQSLNLDPDGQHVDGHGGGYSSGHNGGHGGGHGAHSKGGGGAKSDAAPAH
jgi:cytochrome c oxidase subunit 4